MTWDVPDGLRPPAVRTMVKKVLLVCTGNTCRSPMAEALLRKMAADLQIPLEVQSAGTSALPGSPATSEAVQACRERGLDLASHQSRPLRQSTALESDLVLTMTARHKESVLTRTPALKGKVFLVSEFADGSIRDIEDPIGQSLEVYRKVLGQLEEYLGKTLPKLR